MPGDETVEFETGPAYVKPAVDGGEPEMELGEPGNDVFDQVAPAGRIGGERGDAAVAKSRGELEVREGQQGAEIAHHGGVHAEEFLTRTGGRTTKGQRGGGYGE